LVDPAAHRNDTQTRGLVQPDRHEERELLVAQVCRAGIHVEIPPVDPNLEVELVDSVEQGRVDNSGAEIRQILNEVRLEIGRSKTTRCLQGMGRSTHRHHDSQAQPHYQNLRIGTPVSFHYHQPS
jgi:hypothetical protein